MSYYHQIDTRENPTPVIVPETATAGLQVVIGAFPVNTTENPAAYVNAPVVAHSWAEYVELLGYSSDYAKYPACQSAYLSFQVFGISPVVFINVLDPATHRAEFSVSGKTVSGRQATLDDLGVLLSTLAVTTVISEETVTLVQGTDYIAAFNDLGGVDITLLTTEHTEGVTEVAASGYKLDPTAVTKNAIIGGYDASTGAETGIEAVRKVYPKTGLVPGTLLAPGWSSDPDVAAVLAAKAEDINGVFQAMAAIDMNATTVTKYSDIAAAKTALAVNSERAVLLWPKMRKGTTVYDYSAVWAAAAAKLDADNNDVPYMSPSNKSIEMSAAVLADGTEVLLDQVLAGEVNGNGVVTAINDGGWRAWGNNTAAYPMNKDPKDRWIPCRRMMNWIRNHLILTYKDKVDEPTNPRLVQSVVQSENSYLNSLAASGYIASGSYIEYDEGVNTIENILNGQVTFSVYLAFWPPAEHITFEITFDPAILSAALGGE